MSLRLSLVALSLAVCSLSVATPVAAQSSDPTARAAARRLGAEGVDAFEAGKYDLASEKLEKAYAVVRAPSLGLWSARALAKRGKLIQAADRYLEVTRLPIEGGEVAVQKKAQADAQQELENAQASIPSVIVKLEGRRPDEVKLTIDGAAVSSQLVGEATPINPGQHRIEATSGRDRIASDVVLAQGEQKSVLLVLPAQAAQAAAGATQPGPSDAQDTNRASPSAALRRTLGFVALGVGGAGLVVGGVSGGLAISKKSSLDDNPQCADDRSCPRSAVGDVDAYNTLRTVSSVGLIAGGVLAGAGLVLVLTSPSSSSGDKTALVVSPSAVTLRGRF